MAYTPDTQTQRADLAFVRHLMKAPLLEREEESRLAHAWHDDHNENALHQLVQAYMRLVISISLRFRHYGLPLSDVIQEGIIGLMQAAEKFEPEREVRFSTYAKWWIRSSIQDYVLRNWSIVRTGSTSAQKQLFFNLRRLRAQLATVNGDHMSPEDREKIAETLHVTSHEVEDMENRLAAHDLSLSNPMGDDSGENWLDFLTDERPDPEVRAMTSFDDSLRRLWIRSAMHELSKRERYIVTQRRLIDHPETLESIGKRMNISKERVRQLESRALKKMHDHLLNKVENIREFL